MRNWRSSKAIQNIVARLAAPFDIAALSKLRNRHQNQTLFLLGNGPSLRNMDLTPLFEGGVPFMTVNSGVRMLPAEVRIPMHAVSDINRYVNHAEDIERANVDLRFYRSRFRIAEAYKRFHRPDQKTVFVPYRKGGVLKRGFQPDAARGLGNDSTVLIFAAQLGYYLGFSTINVLGCDLDYSARQPYAYEMNEADKAHEASAIVRQRRRSMVNANAEFAALRRAFEAADKKLLNCGVGGKLDALERLSFAEALERAKR